MNRRARFPFPSQLAPWLALVLASFLAGPAAVAQEGEDSSDPWPAVFSDRTEVNIVNVDVVVTDKEGKPVLGLKPQDFVLLADGEPVEISNFFAVEEGDVLALEFADGEPAAVAEEAQEPGPKTPIPERQLSLVVFVDSSNISATNRTRVLDRLREFLLANWRPEMRAMVVSHSNGFKLQQPFTEVPHEIFAALESLEKASPVAPRFDLDKARILQLLDDINVEAGIASLGVRGIQDQAPEDMTEAASNSAEMVLPQIRIYAQQRFAHTQQTLRALRSFIDTAAGLDGAKAVLYVSEGLPLRPAEGLYEAYARRVENLAGAASFSPELESARDDATGDFQNLVAYANASKVTFYTLYAAPPATASRGSAAAAGSAGGNFGFYRDSVDATDARNRQESMVLLAEGTGGRSGLTNASFSGVLDGVLTDFDNSYSLGFEAERLPSGALRRVAVKVRDPKLTVRYRRSFREKTEEEKVAASTLAALLLDSEMNPLGISLTAEKEKKEKGDRYIVPLRVQVPLGKLVLLPGSSAHQAQVSMYVAARDEKGRTSEVARHLCPIRIPNAQILVAMGRTAVCGVQLLMREGDQRVAVSIRDELAAVSSTASLSLQVPGIPAPAAVSEGAR